MEEKTGGRDWSCPIALLYTLFYPLKDFSCPLKSCFCHQMTKTNCGIILYGHFWERERKKHIHHPTFEVGLRYSVKFKGKGGCLLPDNILFLLLIPKYWCCELETFCVCYYCPSLSKSHVPIGFLGTMWKSTYFPQKSVKTSFFFVTLTSFRDHNWVHFAHRTIVFCYFEFKLCYLQNLKLFQLE